MVPRRSHEFPADHTRKAKAEQRQRKSGGDLICRDAEGQEGKQQRECRPGKDSGQNADPGRAGQGGGDEPADRAHHHHAFDAEIEHTGALDDEFADRRDQQRCCRSRDGQQDAFSDFHDQIPSLALARPKPENRTR